MWVCVGEDVTGICKQLGCATGTNKRSSTSTSICWPCINLPGLCLFAYNHLVLLYQPSLNAWHREGGTAEEGEGDRVWQLGDKLAPTAGWVTLYVCNSQFVFLCLFACVFVHAVITCCRTCSRRYSNQNRTSPTVPSGSYNSSLQQWNCSHTCPWCHVMNCVTAFGLTETHGGNLHHAVKMGTSRWRVDLQ